MTSYKESEQSDCIRTEERRLVAVLADIMLPVGDRSNSGIGSSCCAGRDSENYNMQKNTVVNIHMSYPGADASKRYDTHFVFTIRRYYCIVVIRFNVLFIVYWLNLNL